MPRPGPDFAFLTDPSAPRTPPLPVIGPLARVVAARLRSPRWGEVSFRPSSPPATPPSPLARGVVVLVRGDNPHRLVAGCLSRTRAARRAGVRLLALGGRLAGQGALALGLARETGLPVSPGVALEAAALLDAALFVLRWRGVDPARARAVVLVGSGTPAAGEAMVEYLGDRTGRVGVYGLDGFRRLTLADRMRATTGAVLEVYRSVERCLLVADLLVVTGEGGEADPLEEFGPGPDSFPGRRTTVIADLVPGRTAPGPARSDPPQAIVRLAGPGPDGPPLGLTRGGDAVAAPPLRLKRVFFARPAGWTGRPEPGAPDGLLSAPLVEAMTRAWGLAGFAGRAGAGERPAGRRPLSPEAMTWIRRRAELLGLRPAALVLSLTGAGGGPYNRLNLRSGS